MPVAFYLAYRTYGQCCILFTPHVGRVLFGLVVASEPRSNMSGAGGIKPWNRFATDQARTPPPTIESNRYSGFIQQSLPKLFVMVWFSSLSLRFFLWWCLFLCLIWCVLCLCFFLCLLLCVFALNHVLPSLFFFHVFCLAFVFVVLVFCFLWGVRREGRAKLWRCCRGCEGSA